MSLGTFLGIASNPLAVLGTGAAMGGDLVGGFMQKSENQKQRAAEQAMNDQNVALQREFAQNGIRWRVADAKAAGIHPLAGLGAQTAQYTPASIVGGADNSMSDMARNMGQNVSRAISATRTAEERQLSSLQLQTAQADLDGKVIDNQIRASELRRLSSPGNPSFPSGAAWSGQGDSSQIVRNEPLKRTQTGPDPSKEAAHVADVGWVRTRKGLAPVPSTDAKERIEDQFMPELNWAVRNYIGPNIGKGNEPPASLLPPSAAGWRWHYGAQEWRPINKDKFDRIPKNWDRVKRERR